MRGRTEAAACDLRRGAASAKIIVRGASNAQFLESSHLPMRNVLSICIIALTCAMPAAAGAASSWQGTVGRSPSLAVLPSPLMDPAGVLSGPPVGAADRSAIGGLFGRPSAREAARETSRGKAILLSALAPGAGHIYSGYDRGYLYLGIEAVAWISYFVLRETGNDREERAEFYAGDPNDPLSNWSFDRYTQAGFCNEPGGSVADSTLRYAWSSDRTTFYDLIETDPKYSCGWLDSGVLSEYRDMRSNSEDFLRWAKYAGAAVLLNHAMAVIDMVRLTQGFDLPGGAEFSFKIDPSPAHPSGTFKIKKEF